MDHQLAGNLISMKGKKLIKANLRTAVTAIFI